MMVVSRIGRVYRNVLIKVRSRHTSIAKDKAENNVIVFIQ